MGRNTRIATTTLLIALAVVLIAGGLLAYYTVVYQPGQLHAKATATSVAGIATGTAETVATTQAQTHVTAAAVAQATSMAVGTQIAMGDLYVQSTNGTPVLNDQLRAQDSNNWDINNSDPNAVCEFANGTFHAKAAVGFFAPCLAKTTNFNNLVFQVEMHIISGHSGGLIIRSDANDAGYYFRISTDGTYLGRRVSFNQNTTQEIPLFAGSSQAVHTGNGQFNQVTAIAQGNEIYMYVNQQYVAKINDDTYKSGSIGVFADSDASGSEIVFRNAQVWKL
jgi:hypothetical protein